MEKDPSGAVLREVAAIRPEGAEYVAGAWTDRSELTLVLTAPGDVEDWAFEAIFDHYDTAALGAASVAERDGMANPAWEVRAPFADPSEIEALTNDLIRRHKAELSDVFAVIADKRGEYEAGGPS
ncbi:MAG: hypothetical protein LBK41_07675 [Clostridiales bacterium]|jgi:hypothetical protein|nr:hypothetical protein [Clostridiales bacterium]